MSTFLDRVCRQKERELAEKRATRPLEELERRAAGVPVRAFRAAIRGRGEIIAEIKRRSPSVPAFRQSGDPERLAGIYAANGAAAISVVTDEPNFGTSLADVSRVRRVTSLPVLVKDFVIDPYQVVEARAAGADAVLLIARILARPALTSLLDLTQRLGICALVECHDEADIERATACGAEVIGINNRDLGTLEVSLETTRRLAARLPAETVRVSESGLRTRADIDALRAVGIHAFLIGGVLLGADDPAAKLRELCGRNVPAPPGSAGRIAE